MIRNFEYNIDELNNHYSDSIRYPFEEVFAKVSRHTSTVLSNMDKNEFLSYVKTLSGYNTYLINFPNEADPLMEMSSQIPENAQIKLYFDFVTIVCEK
jgi:hypothetical protein